MGRLRTLAGAAGWPWALAAALLLIGALVGNLRVSSLAIGLSLVSVLLALAFGVGATIGMHHLRRLAGWPGIALPALVVVAGWPVVLGVVQPPLAALTVVAALLFVGASGALLIGLFVLAWQHDIGVALFGWGSLALIWGFVAAVVAQDDLVAALTRALASGDFSSLWWLGPLLQGAACLFPLGLLSLAVHSWRIVGRELRAEDPPTGAG